MEATSPVLSGLIRKRSEMSGEADRLATQLAAIGANVAHLDAVIGLFDPAFDLATIRPKRPRTSDATKPGEMSRFVLDALREAGEPVPTAVIAARLMAERCMDDQDRKLVRAVSKRVGMTLRHQERRGTVRSQPGPGRTMLWEVAS